MTKTIIGSFDNAQSKSVADFFETHREDMVSFWESLVSIESGSMFKSDVDNVRDFLVQSFTSIGGTVETVPYEKAGDLIIADFFTNNTGKPVILSGHYDTVFKPGTIEARPFTIKDGRAYGPGALDMKGGITMLFFILQALESADYISSPIRVVLAGDEEVGHQFSTAGKDFKAAIMNGRAAFNFETGYMDDGFVTGRKGGARAVFSCKGIGAHAGNEPEKGRSAILEIAHKVIAIQNLNDFEEGITYNVGTISGGTVVNAVPEEANIAVDIRYRKTAQLDRIRAELQQVLGTTHVEGTKTEMEFRLSLSPMETTDKVMELFGLFQKTAQEIGFGDVSPKYVGGGADSASEVEAGLPTLCAVGVAGGKNHSVEEFADVESLFTRANLVAQTILKLNV